MFSFRMTRFIGKLPQNHQYSVFSNILIFIFRIEFDKTESQLFLTRIINRISICQIKREMVKQISAGHGGFWWLQQSATVSSQLHIVYTYESPYWKGELWNSYEDFYSNIPKTTTSAPLHYILKAKYVRFKNIAY